MVRMQDVEPEYECRFVTREQGIQMVNLYHLARTALCTEPADRQTPYDRMLWAVREFVKNNPGVKPGGAYKDLCGLLGRG